jgi:hydroxyacylglutathione hydrolase
MFFHQFYLEALGHASYLVGDEKTGKALVLDPRRDVDVYFEAARARGMRVSYALDTHGHNDYLSGICELGQRQPVEALGLEQAGLGYSHRSVKDGEVIEVGEIAFEIVHTPGHTPEHISLLVYDRSAGEEPTLLLSGGALLVGDLARPDLLGGPEQASAAAITFCHTIQEKLLWNLPDHLEVFPTHVAGSLCGGNIGSRLSTTLGYERKTNAILARVSSSEEFVDECIRLDNLPAVPPYWRRMRSQNMQGPPLLGVLREPPALHVEEFKEAMSEAVVLDCRSPDAFAAGHIEGALNVGLSPSFPTWAGTVVRPESRVLVVLEEPGDLWEVAWHLLRTGYDVPEGWLSGGMSSWRTSGEKVVALEQMTVHELYDAVESGDVDVLDVRQPAEWAAGHIAGATFITGAELPARVGDVPEGRPLVVVCGSGYRSSVAASVLAGRRRGAVINVLGGMRAWGRAGYPTESS